MAISVVAGLNAPVLIPGPPGNTILSMVTVSANYTASISDHVILCDASASGFTVTIPSAVGNQGSVLHLKVIANDNNSNDIYIETVDSSLIEDEINAILEVVNTNITLVSDGTNWRAI